MVDMNPRFRGHIKSIVWEFLKYLNNPRRRSNDRGDSSPTPANLTVLGMLTPIPLAAVGTAIGDPLVNIGPDPAEQGTEFNRLGNPTSVHESVDMTC